MDTSKQVIEVISQFLNHPVTEDTRLLRETYMDSLDMAELSCIIESHFNIEVRWSEWMTITNPDLTVGDIVKLVDNHLKQ